MKAGVDAAVIGSGHNGLTCACYLAKAGLDVLVLERSPTIGGMTGTAELTLPGFHSDVHAFGYQFANLSPVPQELELFSHGLDLIYPELGYAHAFPDGGVAYVSRDIERTCRSIARYSQRDAATWRALTETYQAAKTAIAATMHTAPPPMADEAARAENDPDAFDSYRFGIQSLRSWANETFAAEETKILFGAFAHHVGAAPDDAGGARMAWLFPSIIQDLGNNAVRGGMGNLPRALSSCLQAHGGRVRTHAKVRRIVVEHCRAIGVELDSGEHIPVRRLVASSADPQHLALDLLGEQAIGESIAKQMRRYEWGDSTMGIYVALSSPITYRSGPEASQAPYVHAMPASMAYYARAYNDARSGTLSANPMPIICNDSATDPSRAPEGRGLIKILVQPVPYAIRGDATGSVPGRSWEEAKEPYADFVLRWLSQHYIPDLMGKILRRVVLSPEDYERGVSSSVRGTGTHGGFFPYQMGAARPIPALGRYRSPIENVFLCGSGSHPGPGVSFGPGRIAAQVICDAFALPFPA